MATQQAHTVTLSVRIPQKMQEQLDELSEATGRTRSFLTSEAIESYLSIQAWQVSGIKKAVKKADQKGTRFVEHEAVKKWLNSWGTSEKKDKPECE